MKKNIFLLILFLTLHYFVSAQMTGLFHGAIKDNSGNLWFANIGEGVYRFDAITEKFTNYKMKDGLPSDRVNSVYQDKSGIFWISTESGICRYDGKSFTKFVMKETACPFDVEFLYEDSKGNFWFSSQGYGICRYNPRTNEFRNFTKEDGLGSNTVQCMLEDKAGNFWFGERAGGVCRFDPITEKFTKVQGTCFSNQIMGIVEDNSGSIWFANLYNGLCRYDPSTGTYKSFTEADGICHNNVTCLIKDSKGNLWFGSDSGKLNNSGGGLCRYDVVEKSFKRFTDKDGISQMNVWTIVEDSNGNIWVGTKGGLYMYHPQSGKFVDYTFKVNTSN